MCRVPQSLQHYGVFQYSDELMAFLKSEQLMEPGHVYELEIRYRYRQGCGSGSVKDPLFFRIRIIFFISKWWKQ